MTCKICLKAGKTGLFVNGSRNYRLKTLHKHAGSRQHKAAVEAQAFSTVTPWRISKSTSEEYFIKAISYLAS